MANLSTVTHLTYRQYLDGLKQVPDSRALFRFDPIVQDLLMDQPLGEVVKKAYELDTAPIDYQCNADGDFEPTQCRLYINGTKKACFCVDVVAGVRRGEEVMWPGELTCTQGEVTPYLST